MPDLKPLRPLSKLVVYVTRSLKLTDAVRAEFIFCFRLSKEFFHYVVVCISVWIMDKADVVTFPSQYS